MVCGRSYSWWRSLSQHRQRRVRSTGTMSNSWRMLPHSSWSVENCSQKRWIRHPHWQPLHCRPQLGPLDPPGSCEIASHPCEVEISPKRGRSTFNSAVPKLASSAVSFGLSLGSRSFEEAVFRTWLDSRFWNQVSRLWNQVSRLLTTESERVSFVQQHTQVNTYLANSEDTSHQDTCEICIELY